MSSSTSAPDASPARSHPLLAPRLSSSTLRKTFFIPSPSDVQLPTFHPKSTMADAMNVTAQAAAVGLFVSVVQNALAE